MQKQEEQPPTYDAVVDTNIEATQPAAPAGAAGYKAKINTFPVTYKCHYLFQISLSALRTLYILGMLIVLFLDISVFDTEKHYIIPALWVLLLTICTLFITLPITFIQHMSAFANDLYDKNANDALKFINSFTTHGVLGYFFMWYSTIFTFGMLIWGWLIVGNQTDTNWKGFHDDHRALAVMIMVELIIMTVLLFYSFVLICVGPSHN